MYGNKKNQTQHMETTNTHKACTRDVAKICQISSTLKMLKIWGEKKEKRMW